MESHPSLHSFPLKLEANWQCCNIADKWALSWIVSSNNGQNVAATIQQDTTYGISNGPYEDDRGTSGFSLAEDYGEINRIMGGNKIPGEPME